MKPEIVVIGTGRDGTVSMSHFIQQLFDGESQNRNARHEYASRDCYNFMEEYYRCTLEGNSAGGQCAMNKLTKSFRKCPYNAIVGNGYAYAYTKLPDIFSKNVKFIHLKRNDRDAFIASLVKCCELFPEANGNYIKAKNVDNKVWRMAAFHFGEMTEDQWHQLSLIDKCSWYYDRTHELIEKMKINFTDCLDFSTEDLSDIKKLNEVANFLKIKPVNEISPVKKNAFCYADVTMLDSFNVPRGQWLYSNFDCQKSVQDQLYAIDYFCERFISWNRYLISDQDKGELERYVIPENELVETIREGKAVLEKWQAQFNMLEKRMTAGLIVKIARKAKKYIKKILFQIIYND